MEQKKLHIEKNTIQETLVIPLFARKLCTQLYPELFSDPGAEKLVDRLDYDFAAVQKQFSGAVQRFGALEIAVRQMDLAMEVKEYLAEHPRAAVVNLGCGLDQTGENCDNGTCRIYNIDMPDVIAVRDQLLPAGERTVNLPCDLNDHSWFEKIEGEDGAVFFASGVFYYFEIPDARSLMNGLAEHFPGGKLVFDITGKLGLKMMLKGFVRQAGIRNVGGYFHVGSIEKDVNSWLRNAKASGRPYMLGYHDLKLPCVPGSYRMLGRFGDRWIKMQILRLDFDRK